ncbi:MAG: helix-turn-helix domain-containing protein [Victivallaceae bacterium]
MELWKDSEYADSQQQNNELLPLDFNKKDVVAENEPGAIDAEPSVVAAASMILPEKEQKVEVVPVVRGTAATESKPKPETNVPAKKIAVSPLPTRKIIKDIEDEVLTGGHFSLGKYLQEARVQNGLSLFQVEMETKIRKNYIESLEREDFSNLPPSVYVIAYIRKLCSFYKVSAGKCDLIMEELKQHLDFSVPENMFVKMDIDHEVDEENEQKLKYLLWGLAAAVIFFGGMVTIAVMMLVSPGTSQPPRPANATTVAVTAPVSKTQFDQNRLSQLTPNPRIEMSELPGSK